MPSGWTTIWRKPPNSGHATYYFHRNVIVQEAVDPRGTFVRMAIMDFLFESDVRQAVAAE
jgi:hypothetical protein